MVFSQFYIFKQGRLSFFLCVGALSLLVVIFALSGFLKTATFSLEKRGLYYVPSLDYLRLISGSHKYLFSAVFFIRGILDLNEEFPSHIHRLDYLLKNFYLATALDPKLVSGYFFGGIVVPVGKDEIPQGIKFLKEAMKRNPLEWRIPFWLGFRYYELGEYLKTIEYYKIASSLPDAPNYLKTNLAYLYYKAERPGLGLLYLEGLYQSVKDKRMLEAIKIKIEWLKNIVFLEEKVKEFKEIYGFWPKDLEELLRVGLIDKIPEDPFGRGYELDEEWYRNPGQVKSKF